MNDVFKALADESRRKLLDELHRESGQTLGQLCGQLDMTRQAVAKHLRLLEDANLVAVVWRGREKLHYLNAVPIHEVYERWISKYQRDHLQALSELKTSLEKSGADEAGPRETDSGQADSKKNQQPKQGPDHDHDRRKTKVRIRHPRQHQPGKTLGRAD